MKKKISILLVLVLIICMLPSSVFAAGVYDMSISITDKYCSSDKRTNEEFNQSVSYVSGSTNMIQQVAELIAKCYVKGDKTTDFYNFQSPAMKALMDEGLEIASKHDESTKTEWATYVEEMNLNNEYNKDRYKNLFLNYDATIDDYGTGTIVIEHENTDRDDSKFGVVYTVTITITNHVIPYIDVNPTPTSGTETITVVNSTETTVDGGSQTDTVQNGEIIINNQGSADPGTTIDMTAVPDEGKMLKYVDVRDQDGNKVELTYDKDGNFTFEMPEGGVTINAVFQTTPELPSVTGVGSLLNADDHIAFMQGDVVGTFRPNDSIKRCEVAQIFYNLLLDKNVQTSEIFGDIEDSDWYSEAVNVLATLGIIEGYGGNYVPERAITRAEFAAIATRFAKAVAGENNFTDVDDDYWAAGNIATAATYGWITGYEDGSFAPQQPITRQEAAAIVNRMLYRFGDQIFIDDVARTYGNRFPDVDDTLWGWYEINEAVDAHDYDMEVEFVHEGWID